MSNRGMQRGATRRATLDLSGLAGPLEVESGGTGLTTFAVGDILHATGTMVIGRLADVATGSVILSGGVGGIPTYGKVGLTTHISGTLGAANGGTGVANNAASTQTITGNFGITWTVTGATGLTLPTSGTVTALGNATVGSGSIVLATSPTLTTPALGAATATSINFGQTTLNYYGEGTWTPIDASGATLTFTAAAGTYTRIGRLVHYGYAVTYPVTADGSTALLGGLPFTVAAGNENRQGFRSVTTEATLALSFPTATGTTISLSTAVAGAITNVTLSTDLAWGGGFYNV